jgi:hypothetical protein
MLIHGSHKGHAAIWLENQSLRVGVLPNKGADIFELTYLPDKVQFLMETPWGLQPPGDRPQAEFLENYEGGWQELFPNHNDACSYRGHAMPMHGEVALLPWEVRVLRDEPGETTVHFQVRCRETPFLLERTLRVRAGDPRLTIEEKVTNLSADPCDYVWGHHVVLGGDFLEAGCTFEAPAASILTLDELFEPETARLAPGQNRAWPYALGRRGESIDLRPIPGPEAHTHDDACLTGFTRGHYTVTNPRLGLNFSMDWDKDVFPWVMLWQPYGGSDLLPLTGIYGLGVEPWVARYPLEQAVREGQARKLDGGESFVTALSVAIGRM